MASKYNYQNGKMEFDFVLRKYGGVCHRNDSTIKLPPIRIGGDVCGRCRFYGGSRMDNTEYEARFFVMCKQNGAQDEGTWEVWHSIKEELFHSALCALDS